MQKICVIGLGEIGKPVAKYVKEKGLEVWGYDINPNTVQSINKNREFKATTSFEQIPKVDGYIICVTTSLTKELPNLSAVYDTCKKIAEIADSSTIVSIESTIIPGTCRKIFNEIFDSMINLIHVPHRYWADDPLNHGVNQLRVLGGVNEKSKQAGIKLYRELLGIQLHIVSSVEVAEMSKITENSHRYLQIAFAEELKMACHKIGLSFEELREACNTKWNVDIPEAREGIGRHCLPKDIKYVMSLINENILLSNAEKVDKKYREWINK